MKVTGGRGMISLNQNVLGELVPGTFDHQAMCMLIISDSLGAHVLRTKSKPNGRLEDNVCSANPSASWQGITHGLDLLKKGLIWRIENGT